MLCRIRVLLLGYAKGHAWEDIENSRTSKSIAVRCTRCTEIGYRPNE